MAHIETLFVTTPSGGDSFEDASVNVGENAVLTVNYTHDGERLRKHYSPSGWLSYEVNAPSPGVQSF